ncbi:MAG: NAD-dependent epimerase/dehydratase family protein [Bacteroidota bacterium]
MATDTILVTGAKGQIGSELVLALRKIYGESNVVASDISAVSADKDMGRFELLDVTDSNRVHEVLQKNNITQIYHLAALLSGTSEKNPALAWKINMDGLFNVLDNALDKGISKVFWPSSIAVFGPNSPKSNTQQYCAMDPTSVYGVSKLAGEGWIRHYNLKRNMDIRSVRYPGLISYKTKAGGGTTDYAVDIYFEAKEKGHYTCFLKEDTYLPMMYMPDAIRGTIELMEAPKESILIKDSYNLSAMSFSPKEVVASIQKEIPTFTTEYIPDFRQAIADSWPQSIDASYAAKEWNWKPEFDLDKMTKDMLANVDPK